MNSCPRSPVFFAGFNVMEAVLPSLVTKTAPAVAKGTASGVYSSSQFLGIFTGGVIGGLVHQTAGDTGDLCSLPASLLYGWLSLPRWNARNDLTTRLVPRPNAQAASAQIFRGPVTPASGRG